MSFASCTLKARSIVGMEESVDKNGNLEGTKECLLNDLFLLKYSFSQLFSSFHVKIRGKTSEFQYCRGLSVWEIQSTIDKFDEFEGFIE